MRLAFIGSHGHHYLRSLGKETSVPIERPVAWAACAPNETPPAKLTESLGELRLYDDAKKMLDEYRPDVVSVGAIYAHNGDHIAAALQRGIGVVSDKPIAATWEQLDLLRKLCEDSKRIVLTEFDFHSRPEFRAAREIIRTGRIGQPVLATAQKSYRFGKRPAWYADRASYGGTMLWVASHAIDSIRFTTGKRFRAVAAKQGNVSQPSFGTMEDHCTAIFELEDGATGIVHADYLRPEAAPTHGDDRLRVAGSTGVLEVRNNKCTLLAAGGEEDVTNLVPTKPMHLELLAALRGEERDLYSTEASLELAAAMLHARDAADRGEWIRF